MSPSRLLGFGFALAALLPAVYFETTATKYLGMTLTSSLVLGVVARVGAQRAYDWIAPARQAPHPQLSS